MFLKRGSLNPRFFLFFVFEINSCFQFDLIGAIFVHTLRSCTFSFLFLRYISIIRRQSKLSRLLEISLPVLLLES